VRPRRARGLTTGTGGRLGLRLQWCRRQILPASGTAEWTPPGPWKSRCAGEKKGGEQRDGVGERVGEKDGWLASERVSE